jgi:hypothetical protein
MNEALAVYTSESGRQSNGDAHDARQFEPWSVAPIKNPIQGLAAGILEDEHRPTVATGEFQWTRGPCGIKLGCDRVFMLEPAGGSGVTVVLR